MNTTTGNCVQTPTTTCISVPTDGLRGVSVKYNGRGTQNLDAAIVGAILLAIVAIAVVIAWANRKVYR